MCVNFVSVSMCVYVCESMCEKVCVCVRVSVCTGKCGGQTICFAGTPSSIKCQAQSFNWTD